MSSIRAYIDAASVIAATTSGARTQPPTFVLLPRALMRRRPRRSSATVIAAPRVGPGVAPPPRAAPVHRGLSLHSRPMELPAVAVLADDLIWSTRLADLVRGAGREPV